MQISISIYADTFNIYIAFTKINKNYTHKIKRYAEIASHRQAPFLIQNIELLHIQ